MSYNIQLASQIRKCIQSHSTNWNPEPLHDMRLSRLTKVNRTRFEERQLFGGLAFLVNGKMALAVVRDDLLIHTEHNHHHSIDPSMIKLVSSDGNPIDGWALISKANRLTEKLLSRWINLGIQTTLSPIHPQDSLWNCINRYPSKVKGLG